MKKKDGSLEAVCFKTHFLSSVLSSLEKSTPALLKSVSSSECEMGSFFSRRSNSVIVSSGGDSLLMSVKGGVREALAAVLAKELAVAQSDVVDLVAGAAAVHALPLLRGLLSLSGFSQRRNTQQEESGRSNQQQQAPSFHTQRHSQSLRENLPHISYRDCLEKKKKCAPFGSHSHRRSTLIFFIVVILSFSVSYGNNLYTECDFTLNIARRNSITDIFWLTTFPTEQNELHQST